MNLNIPTPEHFRLRMFSEIDRQGYLYQYSSFGCYTILYYTAEEDVLCANCAEAALLGEEESPPVCRGVYWEGPSEECASCGCELESSYGDPDAEEEEEVSA